MIAPSGAVDAQALRAGVERLRTRYEVRCRIDPESRRGYLAGDDGRRLAELIEAIENPECEAVVAARGGYGATRLLESLPTDLIAQHPKLLVGFSDITALHAAWHRAGLRSLHASMAIALGKSGDAEFERWCSYVEGTALCEVDGLPIHREGKATGPLCGGNLAVIAALLGTPHAPNPDGSVLFFEDVGERPFRVDRLLDQLHRAGWFRRASAVIFGQFTECQPNPDGVTIPDILSDLASRLEIPMVSGFPSGHGQPNQELALGAPVRVDAHAGKVTFLEGAVYNSPRR